MSDYQPVAEYSETENSRENRRAALYAATTLYEGKMTATETITIVAEKLYVWLEEVDDTQRC